MLHVHICIKVAPDWQIVEEKRFSTTGLASVVTPRTSPAGKTEGRWRKNKIFHKAEN